MERNQKVKKVHVIYTGYVQGIGFRFTACHMADRFKVYGWVKNLHSGDVELVVEGEEKTLIDFLKSLENAMTRYIRNKEVSWTKGEKEFKSFDIRY